MRALGCTRPPLCRDAAHGPTATGRGGSPARRLGRGNPGGADPAARPAEGIAIDGKTRRGSRQQGAAGAHLLSALAHRVGVTLAQHAVEDKTNEIPVSLERLAAGGAGGAERDDGLLRTQRLMRPQVVDAGGD